MIRKIVRFFWILQIIKQKKRGLFEAQCDAMFLETVKGRLLKFNDNEARKELSILAQKEDRTKEDEEKIVELESDINEAKAIKNVYAKSKMLRTDLVEYIDLLKQCLKDGNY